MNPSKLLNLVPLLSLIDRRKVDASAVATLASLLGYKITEDAANAMAVSMRDRGVTALLASFTTYLKSGDLVKEEADVGESKPFDTGYRELITRCPQCGNVRPLVIPIDQVPMVNADGTVPNESGR